MAVVGLLLLHLYMPQANSLKDKRKVLQSLRDRLRRRLNVSVAEIQFQEKWQRSVLGVVTVAESGKRVQKVLENAKQEAECLLGSVLISSETDLLLP